MIYYQPLFVPKPKISSALILQPLTEWWAHCWATIQYKYLKFVETNFEWVYMFDVLRESQELYRRKCDFIIVSILMALVIDFLMELGNHIVHIR